MESSLNKLDISTKKSFPSRDKSKNNVAISNKEYIKFTKQLLLKAKVIGESSTYKLEILFEDVSFTSLNDPNSIKLHNEISILPIKKSTDVKVSCSCLDFHWTFAFQNNADGSLRGEPPKPYNKTTNRAPRNPSNAIGICKHLSKLKSVLEAEGLFK
jgi:hypothetical protein